MEDYFVFSLTSVSMVTGILYQRCSSLIYRSRIMQLKLCVAFVRMLILMVMRATLKSGFFLEILFSLYLFFTVLSHQQVEIINELEEKSTEIRASEAVDYKKRDRVNESKTAVHASGGKYMYRGLHGVPLQVQN